MATSRYLEPYEDSTDVAETSKNYPRSKLLYGKRIDTSFVSR